MITKAARPTASLTKPVLLTTCAAALVALGAFAIANQPGFSLRATDYMALFITGGTALLSLSLLVSRVGREIELDLRTPLNLFILFYLAYYLVGDWISVLSNAEARRNGLYISLLAAVGLGCFIIGSRLINLKYSPHCFYLNASQRRALLIFCITAMGLLVWYYAWHISIGAFYTHVDYTVDTTVFAGLMETAVAPLQLPLVLLLGLILRSSEPGRTKIRIRRLLYGYAAASVFVYAASSQFRPLAATLLFTIASINIARKQPLKLKAYFVAGTVSALMLATILAVRSVAVTQDWSKSANQLEDSLSALSSSQASDAEYVHHDTFNRLLNQQNLLSHIVDEIETGHPFVHGELLLSSVYSLVPRAFWPAKPAVTPMQIMLRLEFGLPPQDDSVGPLLEAYANGGWAAVIGSFLCLGFVTAWFTYRAANKPTIASVLIICWWWSLFANLEQELLLAILGGLRLIAIAAVIVWLLKAQFVRKTLYLLKVLCAGALVTLCCPFALALSSSTRSRDGGADGIASGTKGY